jgi:hypothetical protein
MEYKKLMISFAFLTILLITPLALVNAFGVTTHYWDEKPLIMQPGQTEDTDVVLQNMVDNKDVRLIAEITNGSEIATLIDPSLEYLVPFGRKDIKVNIRVTIPENVPLESRYNIAVSFKQIAEEEGKMVQITGSVETNIPVVIRSAESSEEKELKFAGEVQISPTTFVLIILAIIIIVIIYNLKKKKVIK